MLNPSSRSVRCAGSSQKVTLEFIEGYSELSKLSLKYIARTSRVQIKICDVMRCYEVHPLYYSRLGTYPWYWGPCTCGQKSRSRSFCQVSGRHCIPATCHGRNKGRTRTKLTQSQRVCQDTKTQWLIGHDSTPVTGALPPGKLMTSRCMGSTNHSGASWISSLNVLAFLFRTTIQIYYDYSVTFGTEPTTNVSNMV